MLHMQHDFVSGAVTENKVDFQGWRKAPANVIYRDLNRSDLCRSGTGCRFSSFPRRGR